MNKIYIFVIYIFLNFVYDKLSILVSDSLLVEIYLVCSKKNLIDMFKLFFIYGYVFFYIIFYVIFLGSKFK